jgi:hypothetical protein
VLADVSKSQNEVKCQLPDSQLQVVADFESEVLDLTRPDSFRDLSRPLGAQTDRQREVARQRFAALAGDADTPPFHYGSHYSSPGIALFYLIRLEPFTGLARYLQVCKAACMQCMQYMLQQSVLQSSWVRVQVLCLVATTGVAPPIRIVGKHRAAAQQWCLEPYTGCSALCRRACAVHDKAATQARVSCSWTAKILLCRSPALSCSVCFEWPVLH